MRDRLRPDEHDGYSPHITWLDIDKPVLRHTGAAHHRPLFLGQSRGVSGEPAGHLTAPWTLVPQTTDLATAREWLESWTDVGAEGILVKPLNGRLPAYRGVAR
ncbi:hypothetical protein ACWGQT_15995 [Streptomyces yangpuensis]